MNLTKTIFNSAALLFCSLLSQCAYSDPAKQKVVITGICRNVAKAVPNTIKNIEEFGIKFGDYAVIIYENNSTDNTASLFKAWAQKNPHVTFISENVDAAKLPKARTEKIARARNIVLEILKDPKFKDFEYTLMADLDFTCPWPITELVNTLQVPFEWDVVSANGVKKGVYYDRYAFRDNELPFGPELFGNGWWKGVSRTSFSYEGVEWFPVYSAFAGMALYKTATIVKCAYSGTVTEDLKHYYEGILTEISLQNEHLISYKKLNKTNPKDPIEIIFRRNTYSSATGEPTCCEHLPFYASMAMLGHDKFFVNPKMMLYYCD